MRKNELRLGATLSYLQMGLNILIGLLYTPVMLRCLGQSEYGIYNTISSTIATLNILSLGFNSSYIKYFSKYKSQNDQESINKLNGLFMLVFLCIGAIALICGLYISFHLEVVFDTGLTASEYEIARVLSIICSVQLAVSFPMSVFTSIISANEKYVFLKTVGMIRTVFGPLVTVPVLLLGYRSIAMVIVSFMVSLVADGIYMYYVIIPLHNKFIYHDFEKGLFISLFVYTSYIAINTIVDQVNWNIDKILLGRFKGTVEVAIYSVGFLIYRYYQQFSSSISSVYTPKIHNTINTIKDERECNRVLTNLMIGVGRVQFIILSLLFTGFIFFGRQFIHLWAGEDYSNSYIICLILMVSATVPLIQNVGIEIQYAKDKQKFRTICCVIMAAANLVISIILGKKYGAVGCTIGTAISLILVNGIAMNFYYRFGCGLEIGRFWISILKTSRTLIIPIVIGIVLTYLKCADSILGFILSIGVYVTVYLFCVWIFALTDKEKDSIKKKVKILR